MLIKKKLLTLKVNSVQAVLLHCWTID